MELESHCGKRQGTEQYESDKRIIAQFLNRFFKIESADFSENDVLKICGIIQVRIRITNYEVTNPKPETRKRRMKERATRV